MTVLSTQVLPYVGQMKAAMGPVGAGLIGLGGVAYTVGAVIYARRWPDPWVRPEPCALTASIARQLRGARVAFQSA